MSVRSRFQSEGKRTQDIPKQRKLLSEEPGSERRSPTRATANAVAFQCRLGIHGRLGTGGRQCPAPTGVGGTASGTPIPVERAGRGMIAVAMVGRAAALGLVSGSVTWPVQRCLGEAEETALAGVPSS